MVTNPAINPIIEVSSLMFGNSFQRSRRNSIFQQGQPRSSDLPCRREICSLLESELVEVELQRPVLIADRDEYGSNLADSGRVSSWSLHANDLNPPVGDVSGLK